MCSTAGRRRHSRGLRRRRYLYGGTGTDRLFGGPGNDTFVFNRGEAHGDTLVVFAGNGDLTGDLFAFIGYGPGATFTRLDDTHWQVKYDGGASHDVITFLNGGAAAIHPADCIFG